LGNIRKTDPRKLAFFTGRDQSQALTGWWAAQFGTPNYAAHGGFCSVNMAAAGIYTIGGSFWEFGEPDWERTRYLLMFGVAEDHDSNPIKIGLGKLKGRPADRGAKFVSVNPIRTGYSAIADEWIGIRPGTDGMFVWLDPRIAARRQDRSRLPRALYNAPWLVVQDPGGAPWSHSRREGIRYAGTAARQASMPAAGCSPHRRDCARTAAARYLSLAAGAALSRRRYSRTRRPRCRRPGPSPHRRDWPMRLSNSRSSSTSPGLIGPGAGMSG
jgi:hypothetical protein